MTFFFPISLSTGTQPFLDFDLTSPASRDPKIDTDRLPVPKCMGVWVYACGSLLACMQRSMSPRVSDRVVSGSGYLGSERVGEGGCEVGELQVR